MNEVKRPSLMRQATGSGHAPVGYMELFFDLVYVFAITQLSHFLLENLNWTGALQVTVLFIAVWWAWMFTAWGTNWVDPERTRNRLMIGGVMIGGLIMAAALPHAFGKTGLVFALAYVAIQLGRSFYLMGAMGELQRGGGRNMRRIFGRFVISAVPWIIGGLTTDPAHRLMWWGLAAIIDLSGPLTFFAIPGFGRSNAEDWVIAGGHLAERCALFIIIVLGECLLMTGATFGKLEPTTTVVFAFLIAFLGSFAMWWIYFDVGAKRGADFIVHHEQPGIVGRNAFVYWHIPIVAGIILMAVSDELVLMHPLQPAHADFIVNTLAGMALFLIGTANFKRISSQHGNLPWSHLAGLILTAALGLWSWATHPAALHVYVGVTAIFIVIAVWEWRSFHGGWTNRFHS